MKKVAVITGASSGFGLHTGITLAKKGYFVLATMRNMENKHIFQKYIMDEKTLAAIEVFPLDVTDSQSIKQFQFKINELNSVDVLINNAGYAAGGFAEEVPLEQYMDQFKTNVFGAMEVTKAVIPKMREQQSGKIINMGSISGLIGFPGMSPYSSSKFALEGYSESLRMELKPFGIQVAILEPGSYQTNIWEKSLKLAENNISQHSPYKEQIENFKAYITANESTYGNPEEIAEFIYKLIEKPKWNKLRYPIGKGVKQTLFVKKLLPWSWWEKIVMHQIRKGK